MDFPEHIEEQFQWLLTMARTPGWKAQAWHRAQELAASDSMYASFPERLKAEMATAPWLSGSKSFRPWFAPVMATGHGTNLKEKLHD